MSGGTAPPRTPPLPWPAVPEEEPGGSHGSAMPVQGDATAFRQAPPVPGVPHQGPFPQQGPIPHQGPQLGPVPHHTAPYRPLDQGPLMPAPGFGNGWEPLPPRTDAFAEPGHDRRRRTVVAAAALALVLLAGTAIVAGVLLGGASTQDPTATTTAPGQVAATPPAGEDVAAGATVVDGAPFGTDPLRFRSPTGNIGCVLDADGVRCDVTERRWQLPPAPADCTAGWGAGLALTGTSPAGPTCGGDTVADASAAPLEYGQALRSGDVTCVSRRTGVECRNAATGHGFAASRASFDAY
ncbi:DUF6636 domain-containing protein [Pseudonocardia sediminis]|uniref:DUF6636 domain-containing protein n=1 Tax=Pseudonocardia sediminis TaxID=1397368 RepID=UPI001028D97F|nr:DUF6636 domain-containing protein [Pseudonocardia sediminis]